MEKAKEEFLKRFRGDYGYPNGPKSIDEIRAAEFKRLEGTVYLDHAGSTLYSESQLEDVFKELSTNVYGNPHSQSDASMATSDIITATRHQVLDYFNASPKDYKCIFTSGATAALKLVGEIFPWSSESCYMYTMENHNSVLGIREYALEHGAIALAIDIEEIERQSGLSTTPEASILIQKHSVQLRANAKSRRECRNGSAYNLFAFPSECNFSGRKFPLDLVNIVKDSAFKFLEGSQNCCRGRWMVLIDAAKGCATEPPDLARYPADFVVFSFYKIFGYPTGLGALLVRNEAANLLNKTYFSGGTVSASIADIDFIKRRESTEQWLEDGTLNFLSIASLRHGFKIINTLRTSSVARHASSLATYVRDVLMDLKHENGQDVCTIYGRDSEFVKVKRNDFGPTIAFNLKREDSSWVGYREVEKLASLSGIHLRTGCFCNPGACAKYLGLSDMDLLSNIEAGHVCWDDNDVLHGKPTGAVRVSFGYMSTFEDAEKFLEFIVNSFVRKPDFSGNGHLLRVKSLPRLELEEGNFLQRVHLESITIYPVKSCAGFSVFSWPLSHTGLQYDRGWLLQGPSGEILTQKKVPALCDIHTFIDLGQGKLFLESPYCKEKLQISLHEDSACYLKEDMDVYGQRYEVQVYNSDINMWFAEAIARPCTLVRCSSSYYQYPLKKCGMEGSCRDIQRKLNFVNEAQLLLISEESVKDLNSKINSTSQMEISGSVKQDLVDAMRFRPNLVISGAEPYTEDRWRSLQIGEANFISLGGCSRCQMINLDQKSGQAQKSKEPLATLASYRRVKGRILFGILLRHENFIAEDGEEKNGTETWLHVGQEVHPFLS